MDDRRIIRVDKETLAKLNTIKYALMVSTLEEAIEKLIESYTYRGDKNE
jgi:hypothetical protein